MSKIIVGHEKQKKFLNKIDLKKMHQSWIFFGKKGIGKYSTLFSFLKNSVGIINNLNKVYELSCDNKTSVDDIRELIKHTFLTNTEENDKNFVIIDNADLLNFNSFNALLKTLEEPPKDTIIILILENIKKLPKTIISRCNLLKFNDLSVDDLLEFSKRNELNIDKNFILENEYLIKGSISRLTAILTKECITLIEKTKELLDCQTFKINEMEILFALISKNISENYYIVIDIIYYRIKRLLISNFNDYNYTKQTFKLLKFIKNIHIENNQADLKNQLLIFFVEYFKIKK